MELDGSKPEESFCIMFSLILNAAEIKIVVGHPKGHSSIGPSLGTRRYDRGEDVGPPSAY